MVNVANAVVFAVLAPTLLLHAASLWWGGTSAGATRRRGRLRSRASAWIGRTVTSSAARRRVPFVAAALLGRLTAGVIRAVPFWLVRRAVTPDRARRYLSRW